MVIPVTYSGTLMWELRNSREGETVVQTRRTDRSQMMTSHQGRTSQSHKQIAQTNRTKQDDVMSKNGDDKQCFGMLQSNSGAYEVPETC